MSFTSLRVTILEGSQKEHGYNSEAMHLSALDHHRFENLFEITKEVLTWQFHYWSHQLLSVVAFFGGDFQSENQVDIK